MREPMVLVGFGKHSLADLMSNIDTPEGEKELLDALDKHHWPPRYRPLRICMEEDVMVFNEYMKWLRSKLEKKG